MQLVARANYSRSSRVFTPTLPITVNAALLCMRIRGLCSIGLSQELCNLDLRLCLALQVQHAGDVCGAYRITFNFCQCAGH